MWPVFVFSERNIYMCVCVYIYIYIYLCVYVSVCLSVISNYLDITLLFRQRCYSNFLLTISSSLFSLWRHIYSKKDLSFVRLSVFSLLTHLFLLSCLLFSIFFLPFTHPSPPLPSRRSLFPTPSFPFFFPPSPAQHLPHFRGQDVCLSLDSSSQCSIVQQTIRPALLFARILAGAPSHSQKIKIYKSI